MSLTGDAVGGRGRRRRPELWNAGAEAWLPQGPDDDSVVLIRVEAASAEYWDTPGGGRDRAQLREGEGDRPSGPPGGENERVELD